MSLPLVVGALILAWLLAGRRTTMAVRDARALLGLRADDDADAVRTAHRRLIARVHPDAGGSRELAARVNAARDVLLAEKKQGSRAA